MARFSNFKSTLVRASQTVSGISAVSESAIDSDGVTSIVDTTYIRNRQDFAYSSLTGRPDLLDSSAVVSLVDSDYVSARSSGGGGGIDAASSYTYSILFGGN